MDANETVVKIADKQNGSLLYDGIETTSTVAKTFPAPQPAAVKPNAPFAVKATLSADQFISSKK